MEKVAAIAKQRGETFRYHSTVTNITKNEQSIAMITNSSFSLLNPKKLSILESYSWFSITKMETTEDTILFIFAKAKIYFETEKVKDFLEILTDILPRILRPTELMSLGYFTVPEERPPPTPNSVFLRILERQKLKKRALMKESVDAFFDILTYTQEYVDLQKFVDQEEAIPVFFDVLPLIPTIVSISMASTENVDSYHYLSSAISESMFLEHVCINGKATKHFNSFLRHLSKNKEVPIYGLTFENSGLTDNQVKSIIKCMNDKYICSIGFHNAFDKGLAPLYDIFLPELQKKLTSINLDTTSGVDVEKLFSFNYPNLELVSLKGCSVDVNHVLQSLAGKNMPQLKGINLSENKCNEAIAKTSKLPPNLSTIVVSDVKWGDNLLSGLFGFLSSSLSHDLRLDVSKASASEQEWQRTLSELKNSSIPILKSLIWDSNPASSRFLSFLKKNMQLEYLGVSYSYTEKDVEQMKYFGKFVMESNISSLVIRGNSERYIGTLLSSLLKQLSKSKNLEYLDISGSNAHDKSIVELKKLMKSDAPLRFLSFDGIAPSNPNIMFDLLYEIAGNSKSIAVSFPSNDLEVLLASNRITQSQMDWVTDLFKQPQPTINDQPTSLEYPFEIYKENWKPMFPLFLKPLAPSPDGIRTEDMVNTDVFSEERTEMTVSMTGDEAKLVPVTKDESEKPIKQSDKVAVNSIETLDIKTCDCDKKKNDDKESTPSKNLPSSAASSSHAISSKESSQSSSKEKRTKSHKKRSRSKSKAPSATESSQTKEEESTKKKTRKRHSKTKESHKDLTNEEGFCWDFPITFDLAEAERKVITAADKLNTIDYLLEAIPKH